MDDARTATPDADRRVGHEERDVTIWAIVAAGLGLLMVAVLVFVLMRVLVAHYAAREAKLSPPANPLADTYGRQLPPEPRLQAAPIGDLLQLRAAEDAALNSYGWVDRQAGTVHTPIDRAMELLAQRGLPARAEGGEKR